MDPQSGKGLHSHGSAKIKPAIEELMQKYEPLTFVASIVELRNILNDI